MPIVSREPDPSVSELERMAQQIREAHTDLREVPSIEYRDVNNLLQQLVNSMFQVRGADDRRLGVQSAEAQLAPPDGAAIDQLCKRAHQIVADDRQLPSNDRPETPEPKDTVQPAPEKEPVKPRPEAKKAPRPNSGRNSVNDDEVAHVLEVLRKAGLPYEELKSAINKSNWFDERRNVLRSKPKHQRTH